jgi:hypothetical protein
MLEGIASNEIIVGAYTDPRGGVCPMLAAHRAGGRTDFLSFAHAWDRFTRARRPRRASRRELRTLEGFLQAAVADDTDFGGVIAEHQRTARERRAREARATGWGWLADAEAPAADPEPASDYMT